MAHTWSFANNGSDYTRWYWSMLLFLPYTIYHAWVYYNLNYQTKTWHFGIHTILLQFVLSILMLESVGLRCIYWLYSLASYISIKTVHVHVQYTLSVHSHF